MFPQISDIEDEDLFASTSPQHQPLCAFLHVCVCIFVEGVCLGYKTIGQLQFCVILIFLIISQETYELCSTAMYFE